LEVEFILNPKEIRKILRHETRDAVDYRGKQCIVRLKTRRL
jgi:hypothetical protein